MCLVKRPSIKLVSLLLGSTVLPGNTGKASRVLVFATTYKTDLKKKIGYGICNENCKIATTKCLIKCTQNTSLCQLH